MAREALHCLLAVQKIDDPIEGKTSLINIMNIIKLPKTFKKDLVKYNNSEGRKIIQNVQRIDLSQIDGPVNYDQDINLLLYLNHNNRGQKLFFSINEN